MSRFDLIPVQKWAYLSKALRGLSKDLSAVEAWGGVGAGLSPIDFRNTYQTARDETPVPDGG